MAKNEPEAAKDSAAESSTGRKAQIKARWLVLAAVLIAAAVHFLPLLQSHAEQDDCSFGPVSNERYRELLAEARALDSTKWPPLSWHNDTATVQLRSRFSELSRDSNSVYERIAAMHAVMRSLGSEYRRTGLMPGQTDDRNPYDAALSAGGLVPFHYHLDVNRIGFFRPVRREAWVLAHLSVNEAKVPLRKPVPTGDFIFSISFPEFLDTYVRIPRSGEKCPEVPSPAIAKQLSPAN